MIRQLAGEAAERAPDTRITLELGEPAPVHGDPDALHRLLHNLLDNALAAVPRNGGTVSVAVRRTDEHTEVRITDNGIGIPDARREEIFERYVRLTRATPGHGLGLVIARRIARLHHGDLVCEAATVGAAFTLRLPAGSSARRAPDASPGARRVPW